MGKTTLISRKPHTLYSFNKPSVTMNSAFCLVMFALALLASAVSATVAPMSCFFYTLANTSQATCDEVPGLVCTGGCRDSFVVAEGCRPSGSETGPLTTQTCNIGFGRDTAAAKGCITTNGPFSCKGKVTGRSNCYGCTKST